LDFRRLDWEEKGKRKEKERESCLRLSERGICQRELLATLLASREARRRRSFVEDLKGEKKDEAAQRKRKRGKRGGEGSQFLTPRREGEKKK